MRSDPQQLRRAGHCPGHLRSVQELRRSTASSRCLPSGRVTCQGLGRLSVTALGALPVSLAVRDSEGQMLILPPPLEFGILMSLLSSEDEIVVANAALCLGNCMEVPRAASSLLKTDVVQLLLRHAGGDAQRTAVQLNAGIALGRLCTAEPRYAAAPGGVACVRHIPGGAGQHGAVRWPGLCAAQKCVGSPGAACAAGVGAPSPRGASGRAVTAVLSPIPSPLLFLPLCPRIPAPSLSHPWSEHMGQCASRATFPCWRKWKRKRRV